MGLLSGSGGSEYPLISLVVVVAFALEWTVQEPPERLHPVAWFGRVAAPVDRDWRRPRLVGVAVAIGYPLAGAVSGSLLVANAWQISPIVGVLVASVLLFVTTSLRMLLAEARGVIEASDGEIERARERLPALAGRDADELTPGQLRSGAVESAAENLADGLVAPLLAFSALAPLSIALGAGAACWVKGVNTLDSMVGYPSKPVGTASAKLDDLVMWVPARASAVLLSLVGGAPRSITLARPLAEEPPSPNSGWPMGVLAGLLGVRLEKPDAYALDGGAELPDARRATEGVALVERAGLLAYGLTATVGVVVWL